jgi:hypothetical protein
MERRGTKALEAHVWKTRRVEYASDACSLVAVASAANLLGAVSPYCAICAVLSDCWNIAWRSAVMAAGEVAV